MLQDLAEKLEMAIKERKPRGDVDARLDLLIEPLEKLIAQLEHSLPEEPASVLISVHQKTLNAAYIRLEELLIDDDAEAADVWEGNTNLFNAAFPDSFYKIDSYIRSFNFDAALIALRTANETSIQQGSPR